MPQFAVTNCISVHHDTSSKGVDHRGRQKYHNCWRGEKYEGGARIRLGRIPFTQASTREAALAYFGA